MAYVRKRLFVGWGLIGLGFVVAGLMAASRYYTARTDQNAPLYIVVHAGCVELCWGHPTLSLGLKPASVARRTTPWLLWVTQEQGQPFQPMLSVGLARVERFRPPAGQTTWVVGFVLWPIGLALLATGVPFAVSGRRIRRRARLGLCAACGYDRRGLESGAACPECGKGK